jgi:ElaB/YqjD/DUF883 family membrane-anchored ribosome-binding protein
MSSTADRIDAESRKDPDRLEREIDQQREGISQLVDALEERLSPGQLFDRLVNFSKGNGKEFVQNMGQTVKANPIPLLLTSVGLAWLYASRNDTGPNAGSRFTVAAPDTAGSEDASVLERARDVGAEVSRNVSDRWNQTRTRVADTAARVADSAHEARDTLMQQKERAVQGYNHLLRDNPLALGAIGIAVGALLAAVLPATEPENRLMGEASDQLADKARQAVQAGAEQARETLHDIGEPSGTVRH